MKIKFNVCVLIAFCFEEALTWNRNVKSKEQEDISNTKHLLTRSNDGHIPRPLFYWESSSVTDSNEINQFSLDIPTENNHKLSDNPVVLRNSSGRKTKRKNKGNNRKHRKTVSNDINSNDTSVQAEKKSHKNANNKNHHRRKGKKESKKKNRKKNKNRNNSNVLEIPLKAKNITDFSNRNIKTDKSIQDIISKLNSNPELSHKNLLEDEHKSLNGLINTSSSSLTNFSHVRPNFLDGKNDTRILLASSERKSHKPAAHERIYDIKIDVFNTVVPTTTESIFKNEIKELEDITSHKKQSWNIYNEDKKTQTYPKINYSELLKTSNISVIDNKNLNLVNFVERLNGLESNLDDLRANQIGDFLGKSMKYGKGKCNGCAHFCNELNFHECLCLNGFQLGGDGKSCIDIDECSNNNGGCERLCSNTQGSYYCGCPSGLRIGIDLKSCEDINECLLRNGHGPCQGTCTNTYGSYYCGCSELNGTRLSEDNHTCEDVNECKEGRSGCSHGCINTLGRAFCTCPEGMEMGNDWKTCYDINECDNEEISRKCRYGCLNTVGSYRCLEPPSEQNDQIPVAPEHIVCPPLFPPRHGYFHCSRKKAAVGFKTKYGRPRITNRPGMMCDLVCPVGYKTVGTFRVICNVDGSWVGEKRGKCSPFTKPKMKCPGPLAIQLKPGEEVAHVTFPPPKTSVNWKYVETVPKSAKKLETYLPQGHHWITFKATDPHSKLSTKCIIFIIVKKTKDFQFIA